MAPESPNRSIPCQALQSSLLEQRALIIASNRGPYSLSEDENEAIHYQRSGGGLVSALLGLAQNVEATWVACAQTETDRRWKEGLIPSENPDQKINVVFIDPTTEAYDGYYNCISNPLLWFLQHSIWDFARSPTIDQNTWSAWETGYLVVNRLFADTISRILSTSEKRSLVMFQDYHLYLAPRILRRKMQHEKRTTITHFIHIPWPGPEDWGVLPPLMRQTILEGLCAVDLLGMQTREDSLNFIRTCESFLPGAHVNFREGRVWYRNHATHVRDFPISINVEALEETARSEDVEGFRAQLETLTNDSKLIVRIDRTEPTKNIVRGFLAFEEMLELYPEHLGKVLFLALLVPSRLDVEEYKSYLDELMAAAGRVNARFGDGEWEPVRVMVGENYERAIAAMQLYDVLLVNAIADGMNLVAKEGPIVNQRNGVLILSERAGAVQQLGDGAIVISPCDIYNTAEALHRALVMPASERTDRAERLSRSIREEDIHLWLCWQLEALAELENRSRKATG